MSDRLAGLALATCAAVAVCLVAIAAATAWPDWKFGIGWAGGWLGARVFVAIK